MAWCTSWEYFRVYPTHDVEFSFKRDRSHKIDTLVCHCCVFNVIYGFPVIYVYDFFLVYFEPHLTEKRKKSRRIVKFTMYLNIADLKVRIYLGITKIVNSAVPDGAKMAKFRPFSHFPHGYLSKDTSDCLSLLGCLSLPLGLPKSQISYQYDK